MLFKSPALFRTKEVKEGIRSRLHTLPYRQELPIVTLSLLVCLAVFLSILPLLFRWESASEQKKYWENRTLQTPQHVLPAQIPGVQDLPSKIEEAKLIFQNEGVVVRSFNVERFGDANHTDTSALNFATVRLKLKGSWEGIQSGLTKLESLKRQAIRVQEAKLSQEGGDVLLKIYFYEPDNPLAP